MQVRAALAFDDVKKNKKKLFYSPYHWLFLPYYIYKFLSKRWWSAEEIIYLTLTNCEDIVKQSTEIAISNVFLEIDNYSDFENIAKKREIEDNIEGYCQVVYKRFKENEIAFIYKIEEEVSAYLFVSKTKANLTQMKYSIPLNKPIFAIYDVYTFNKYRKKGFYNQLVRFVCENLSSKGYSKFYLWVMNHNLLSIKAHSKMGINKVVAIFKLKYRLGIRIFKRIEFNALLEEVS